MKTISSITEFASIGLVAASAIIGCGSSSDEPVTSTTSGSAGSHGGATSGSGGAMGSSGATGTGGPAGTGGGPADMADAHGDVASTDSASPEASVSTDGGPVVSSDARTSDGSQPGLDAGPGCTANTLRPGNTNFTIPYAGGNRTYIVHVPASYTGKNRVPLLIDMHGSGGNATGQEGTSGWDRKADATGFIVIYPNALNARWNAGTCCSPSVEQNVDDVGFLRAVVAKTLTDGCIDSKRVYASGLSGGGLMSYRLACEAADIFAAVAPVSGATVFSPCKPSRAVSVVAFRGLSDPLVPYNGGMPLRWYFQGAKADFDQWSMLDQCMGPVTMSHGICQTNTQCSGGADITLCSVNGGHVLYGDAANGGAPVPDVAWEIFQRHALP
jgi:polyhydroxybutyrate depolymerase